MSKSSHILTELKYVYYDLTKSPQLSSDIISTHRQDIQKRKKTFH